MSDTSRLRERAVAARGRPDSCHRCSPFGDGDDACQCHDSPIQVWPGELLVALDRMDALETALRGITEDVKAALEDGMLPHGDYIDGRVAQCEEALRAVVGTEEQQP